MEPSYTDTVNRISQIGVENPNKKFEIEQIAIQPQGSSRITKLWEKIKLGFGDLTRGVKRLGKWVFRPLYRLGKKISQLSMQVSTTVEKRNSFGSFEIYLFTNKHGENTVLGAKAFILFSFPGNIDMENSRDASSSVFEKINEIGFTTLEETLRHLRPNGTLEEDLAFYLYLSEFDYDRASKTSSSEATNRTKNIPLMRDYIKRRLYSELDKLNENSVVEKINEMVEDICRQITDDNEINFPPLEKRLKDLLQTSSKD